MTIALRCHPLGCNDYTNLSAQYRADDDQYNLSGHELTLSLSRKNT